MKNLASQIARERGCPVIAITDSLVSPISENASVLLINKVDNFTFHNSYVSTMMNLELLAGLVSKRNRSENLERLMRMEQYLDQTNQY
ncbi:MAG: SIS domain-containing protein [Paenibacillaceae bacterium]|nr:SIS domain-containing protein [Paenibacillaceae bacterium]